MVPVIAPKARLHRGLRVKTDQPLPGIRCRISDTEGALFLSVLVVKEADSVLELPTVEYPSPGSYGWASFCGLLDFKSPHCLHPVYVGMVS